MADYSPTDEGLDIGSGVSDQLSCTSMILIILSPALFIPAAILLII